MLIELEQYKYDMSQYEKPLDEIKVSLKVDEKSEELKTLEQEMGAPDFWNDNDKAQKVVKRVNKLKSVVASYQGLKTDYEDILTMMDMADEEDDASMVPDIEEMISDFNKRFEEIRNKTFLSGEYDSESAIVTLHAGAGGTESCDWCSMLYRMYTKWAENHGFKTEMLDYLDGDEAGLKMVTFEVEGENAFGYLKSERGVHRLVRISPFNAAGKRQTSFASCDVMPDIQEDLSVEIKDEDIRIDTYRSSGAGGQHINKTSSAIRITHIPTGVVVQCQNERSQHKNKDKAMQILKARLYLIKEEENRKKLDGIRGEVSENGWGSQIRSYVLQPFTMVKDHRTNQEVGNAQSVLDGNLDPFITAFLRWQATGQKVVKEQ